MNLDLPSEGPFQQTQPDSVVFLSPLSHTLKSTPTHIPDCLNGLANSVSSLVVQHTSLGTILPTLLGACLASKSGYRSRGDYWGSQGTSVLSCSEFLTENEVLILIENPPDTYPKWKQGLLDKRETVPSTWLPMSKS